VLTTQEIKNHYLFTEEEAETLRSLLPIAEANRGRMIGEFHDYLLGMPDTALLLQDEQRLRRLKESHGAWFVNLFQGTYDNRYLKDLQRIGHVHVKIGLSAHFVNAAMQMIRRFCVGMIRENFTDSEERRKQTEAMEKMLDINLYIMTASYIEAELRTVFDSQGRAFQYPCIHWRCHHSYHS